jgi:hypothetical protein
MLGVVNSNYSGVNGLMINPANYGASRNYVNVNLLAGDLFLVSNYIYINRKDYRFSHLFKVNTDDQKYMHIYDYSEFSYRDTVRYYDYKKSSVPKNFYFNTRIAGPSVMIPLGRHTISLITGWRNNMSIEKLPDNAANFIFRGQDFVPQHNITYNEANFNFTFLSWIELGISYSYALYKNPYHEIDAGITLKYLLGTGAGYGVVNNVSYMVPNTDSIYFYKMNATIGLDLPMDYSNFNLKFNPLVKGTGFSGDIGINYTYGGDYYLGKASSSNKNSDREPENTYLFRIGLSLLDVGWIRFNKQVQVHEFNNVDNRLWSGLRSFHATSIQELLRSASFHLLGDSMASLTSQNKFTMYLPTAGSVQADFNFGNNIFLNATYVQGFSIGKPAVKRETLLALTPRYETALYEINLPVSIVNFRYPAIGLAVRVYNLVVGTEKLGTFLNLTDVQGIDFYFSLGFNLRAKKIEWKTHKSRRGSCEAYPDYKRYQVH